MLLFMVLFLSVYPKCRCSKRASSHENQLVCINNVTVSFTVTASAIVSVSVSDCHSVRAIVIVIVYGIVSVILSQVSML